jgi:hypothetical protein
MGLRAPASRAPTRKLVSGVPPRGRRPVGHEAVVCASYACAREGSVLCGPAAGGTR